MSRDVSSLPVLNTAAELVAFLRADPNDRVVRHSSDLDPSEFSDGFSTRSDDRMMVVSSMRALGASSVPDFVNGIRAHTFIHGAHPDELAVIGQAALRDRLGRAIPPDIGQLLSDAEEAKSGRTLSWAGFEGLCVLAEHPEAEG